MVIVTLLFTTEIIQDQQKIALEVFSGKNVIDQMSQYIAIAFGVCWSFFPFLIASGLPMISELALANDLKFPKNGWSILLAMAFIVVSNLFGMSRLFIHKFSFIQSIGALSLNQPTLAKLQENYSMTESILVLGFISISPIPILMHTYLCLLVLVAWVERLTYDVQNS